MRATFFRLLLLGLGLAAAVASGRAQAPATPARPAAPAASAAASSQPAAAAAPAPAAAAKEPTMSFEEYEPRSTLVVPEHLLTRARYPFVDVHNHQPEAPRMSAAQVDGLVAAMDRLQMA